MRNRVTTQVSTFQEAMKCKWDKTALQLQNIYRKKQFCNFLEG